MARFFALFALALSVLGFAVDAANAKPDPFEICRIDEGYGRFSSCDSVGG